MDIWKSSKTTAKSMLCPSMQCSVVRCKRIAKRIFDSNRNLVAGCRWWKSWPLPSSKASFYDDCWCFKTFTEKVFPKSIIIIFKPWQICIRWAGGRLHNVHCAGDTARALSLSHSLSHTESIFRCLIFLISYIKAA